MEPLSETFPNKKSQRLSCLLVILASFTFFALSSSQLLAQGYGSVSGTVTDPSGAAIPNASVIATQVDTGRETTVTSSQNGTFVFTTLPPANYSFKVTAPGFQLYQQNAVLQANQSLTVNPELTVGAATQTIEVSTAPPQVDTTTGTMSQVIDRERVVDLPLNGRNAASLMTLVAGVADATNEGNGVNQGNGKTFPAAVVITSNGTLPNQSNYLLDGGNNVDELTNVNAPFPMPDAVQEFSIQTSNYDAQFGQSAGAVVNIVTRAGTSQFHGNAFEFLRNGYFNARPYFATRADNLHRHQFGGTIGGPVIIPHLSKGESTQFFFGYQHTIANQISTSSSTVPTLAEEGRTASGGLAAYADLGNLCKAGFNAGGTCLTASQQIRNPFTNALYPYNRIPSSAFDPASVNYQSHFPTATSDAGPGLIGNLVNYSKPVLQSFDEYTARVDHNFGSRDHLFGRYFYDWYTQSGVFDPNNLLSYASYFNTRYQNALLSETHAFTDHLLNSLVLNYQREVALRGGPPGSTKITDYGVTNIWQPETGPFLQATISGYFGASSSAFAAWGRNNYTFNDDLHWVKGNHNFAFGGHFELSKVDVTNVYTSYGSFGFGSVTNKIGSTTYNYPNAYGNFLMGFMNNFSQGNYELVNDRNHFPGVYAQDSWKATRRLQINYGVRWESFAPWADRRNLMTEFQPSAYTANQHSQVYTNLPAGLLVSGDPGVPYNGVRNQYKQFMPRVGFAYDVFGNGKTSIRGGFGIFYQDRLPAFFNLTQGSYVPNTISLTLPDPGMYGTVAGTNPGGPFSNPYCTGCSAGAVSNPFPFTLPFPKDQVFPNAFQVAEYPPSGDFQVPVTNDFNLIVEQQLSPSWSARVAYVGSTSRHQLVNLEINPAVNNGIGNVNQRRVYNTAPVVGPCASNCATAFSQIVETAMIGNANYNSLQATLQKRMTHDFSVLLNYTFSKSYDDMPQATRVSNTEDVNPGESYVYPLYPANATNIPAAAYVPDIKALDRGLSDLDHTHVLSLSYVYNFPKLHSSFRAANYLVNGWRTTGLVRYRSGDVLTPYLGSDVSLTGLGQDRPNRDFGKPGYNNVVGGGHCGAGKSCVNWLNDAAFSAPVNSGPGTGFGNVVKGSFRGPSLSNWDAAVIRSFPVYRETSLDFRAEYFNVLNHTELANPNTNYSNSSFGTITSTQGDPRIAQFSLKYIF
jgi:hypothetical protein